MDENEDTDVTAYEPEKLQEWQRWSGPGEPPRRWIATDPRTGEGWLIYRSYFDYVG